MHTKSKRRQTGATLLFFALGLTILIAWNDVAFTSAAGCGTPQLSGNPTSVNVGISPRSMASGDFNHDGKSDLAVADYGSGQGSPDGAVSILLNNGLGGFLPAQNIAAGINPRSIVLADFNKDGNADLAVVNNLNGSCCIDSFVNILLGDATGNFTAAAPVAVGKDSAALTVGDFNKDGNPDVAATILASSGGVSVLLGNGAGGLAPAQVFTVGGNPRSITAGDVNGDGNLDLLSGNLFGSNVAVLLGDGNGSFATAMNANTGGASISFVAVGDLNQDLRIDIVAATSSSTLAVVLGHGDGTFGAPTSFAIGSFPESVLVRDQNGDGKLDLAAANSGLSTISVLIGNGDGTFQPAVSYVAGSGCFFIASNDFNGDGTSDLAVANAVSNSVAILSGDGGGGFAGARTFNVGLSPLSVAAGDLNGDGKIDLVVTNANQNSISVLLGDGHGVFGTDVKFPTNFDPSDVILADLNGDGKLDAAVANQTCCQISNSVAVLLGNGNGGFGAPTSFTAGTGAFAIVSADFNKDGHADLAVVNNADNNLSVLLGDGSGSFAAPVNINLQSSPVDIATGDLNGDGNADLITTTFGLTIFMGNGAGGFSAGTSIPIPGGAISIDVGDVNGDGLADLATANGTGSLSVLLGDGLGGFTTGAPFPVPLASRVALADINGDGKTDLTASSGLSNIVVLPGDGAGAFGPSTSFIAGNSPRGIVAADLNGDGRSDLAIANLSGYLSVELNSCPAAPVVSPSVSISDVTLVEGNSGQTNASFVVSLSAPTDQTVTVSYFSSNQTATGGVDYQTVSGHLTFAPGTTTQTITVPINGDTTIEPNETFRIFLSNALNGVIGKGTGTGQILNDEASSTIALSAAAYSTSESESVVSVTVLRSGDLANAAAVDYTTSDTAGANNCNAVTGLASSRCDYLSTIGTLKFAANESLKTITIPIVNDSYAEGSETFTFTLNNASGVTLGTPANAPITITDNDATNGPNPFDSSSFFVRQHYVDFLNREPDTSGLNFWTDQIDSCTPKPDCTEIKRINVSAAFFLSIEFQETGYLVYRIYKAAYSNITGTPVPVRLSEFLPDTQQIGRGVVVGQPGFEQQLENNKVVFALDFVSRPRFTGTYPTTLTPTEFVNTLFANAGVSASATDRDAAINEFGGAGNTADTAARARALRRVAENSLLKQQETNKAFVLMQYFGYLRRNPNDAPEAGLNFDGYNFWLAKLNQFNGNFVNAEMVKAFIVSGEYRQRFGP